MLILLFSVLNDEQRALVERIFHEHHIHFQRISFNIVKSEEAAEDVVSTAFIKIMDNIEKISDLPCPQMTAFCVTIVKNASIDVLRQLQQSVHIDYWDNISDEDTDDIADECIHNADVHRLTEVIDQLDPDDRHFIYLRYTLEMGYREIGELLLIPRLHLHTCNSLNLLFSWIFFADIWGYVPLGVLCLLSTVVVYERANRGDLLK